MSRKDLAPTGRTPTMNKAILKLALDLNLSTELTNHSDALIVKSSFGLDRRIWIDDNTVHIAPCDNYGYQTGNNVVVVTNGTDEFTKSIILAAIGA